MFFRKGRTSFLRARKDQPTKYGGCESDEANLKLCRALYGTKKPDQHYSWHRGVKEAAESANQDLESGGEVDET